MSGKLSCGCRLEFNAEKELVRVKKCDWHLSNSPTSKRA